MQQRSLKSLVGLVCLASGGCAGPGPGNARDATLDERALALVAAEPGAFLADADTRFDPIGALVEPGGEHVRLARRYKGLRVIGGDTVAHLAALLPASMSLRHPVTVDVVPRIGESRAARLAAKWRGWAVPADTVELVIYARGGGAELAYEARRRDDGAEPPRDERVYVSAVDGRQLDAWDEVADAAGKGIGFYAGAVALQTKKKGSSYLLDDPTRGDVRTIDALGASGSKDKAVTSADDQFGTGQLSSRGSIAADVQYGMASAWDYYANQHGRDGVDGAGRGLFARAHYGTRLANAFFDPRCACINLGDGDANAPGGETLPLASLDVVAHEMTHAITRATADLYGSGEAGGLNEATSDIFGTMVERHAKNPRQPADWLMGASVRPPKGIRNMAYPEKDGVSTGCWSPHVGWLDAHRSAGVANHFFYLLSEGSGSGTHTCGTKTTVHGIGADAAAAIWYRALTVYFTSDASFSDAREATRRAAVDLHGAGAQEVKSVAAAWGASGVVE